MKTLLEIQDELSITRSFVECAYMACQDLSPEQVGPLSTVLNAVSDKLKAIGDAIAAIRQPADLSSLRSRQPVTEYR